MTKPKATKTSHLAAASVTIELKGLCHLKPHKTPGAQHLQDEELVINFERNEPKTKLVLLEGAEVEAVDSYKYLGMWLDNKRDWSTHTNHLHRKTQNRMHFLTRVRSF